MAAGRRVGELRRDGWGRAGGLIGLEGFEKVIPICRWIADLDGMRCSVAGHGCRRECGEKDLNRNLQDADVGRDAVDEGAGIIHISTTIGPFLTLCFCHLATSSSQTPYELSRCLTKETIVPWTCSRS